MKTAAMGRGKAKDAYDIYFLIKHYHGGVTAIADLFQNVRTLRIITDMKEKLREKFASVSHAGPIDVAEFMEVEDEERDVVLRDAYEQVQALIAKI